MQKPKGQRRGGMAKRPNMASCLKRRCAACHATYWVGQVGGSSRAPAKKQREGRIQPLKSRRNRAAQRWKSSKCRDRPIRRLRSPEGMHAKKRDINPQVFCLCFLWPPGWTSVDFGHAFRPPSRCFRPDMCFGFLRCMPFDAGCYSTAHIHCHHSTACTPYSPPLIIIRHCQCTEPYHTSHHFS